VLADPTLDVDGKAEVVPSMPVGRVEVQEIEAGHERDRFAT
jgi:hypothetical protein